jgi:hypothetical protein
MTSKWSTHNTGIVGQPGPWMKDQLCILDQSVSAWHEFSLVKHKDLEGRDTTFTKWKKNEANRILSLRNFGNIPAGVSLCCTLTTERC